MRNLLFIPSPAAAPNFTTTFARQVLLHNIEVRPCGAMSIGQLRLGCSTKLNWAIDALCQRSTHSTAWHAMIYIRSLYIHHFRPMDSPSWIGCISLLRGVYAIYYAGGWYLIRSGTLPTLRMHFSFVESLSFTYSWPQITSVKYYHCNVSKNEDCV